MKLWGKNVWCNKITKFKSVFINTYKYLLGNERMMLVFLLFFCFLIFIPQIFLDYEYGREDYPGGDASYILNGAKNIKETGKYDYSTLHRFDIYDGLDRNEITKPAYFYPPLTSLLLAGVLVVHDSIFATKVFQLFLFFCVIIVYFKLVKKIFSKRTAFFSSLLIMSNPLIYMEVFSPVRTHILSLLLTLLFFLIMINKKDSKNVNMIIIFLGVVCGLSYLTRDINLIQYIVFSCFLVYKKEIRKLIIFTFTFLCLVLPWWIRNNSYYGTINPRSKVVGYNYYPSTGETNGWGTETSLELITLDNFIGSIWLFGSFLADLGTPSFFFIFLPFVVLGFFSCFCFPKRLV